MRHRSYLGPDLVDDVATGQIADLVRVADQDVKGGLGRLLQAHARRALAGRLDLWGAPRPDGKAVYVVGAS